MFTRDNYKPEESIAESMAKLLTPKYVEKKASADNAGSAMAQLQKAAEIFENLNMVVAAEAVTEVMESIAGK